MACPACTQLRKEIVEALSGVDTSDWDSMNGSTPREIGAVLRDIASRLESFGRKHEEEEQAVLESLENDQDAQS